VTYESTAEKSPTAVICSAVAKWQTLFVQKEVSLHIKHSQLKRNNEGESNGTTDTPMSQQLTHIQTRSEISY
jgi:hypothetical protein